MNTYISISHLIKISLLTVSVCLLLYPIGAVAGKTSPSRVNSIKIEKSDNTISVNLVNADISDVAKALSEQTGIKVLLDESITRTVTSKFQNMPVEQGIKRLLGHSLSSAFVFAKETGPSGKETYRLDTVKIFNTGKMLSASYKKFDGNIRYPEKANTFSKPDISDAKMRHQMPGSPGAIRYEILQARQNLNIIHKKSKRERDRAKRKVAEIRMKLSRAVSPDERSSLTKKLSFANQELSRINNLNRNIITDEERNLRYLVEEEAKIQQKGKFTERLRESEAQQKLGERRKQ
ncbi:hypothetical protein [Desulfonema magnum]|uniref:Secretin/TonB short N-terminal domain-containing protein n=1 Tax=Desulfonema magnum TaxID=45655 RepID=A0A975BHL2_9BACT|nr:hypothetical protein [Desulfonema magnum]QTA85180.1 Uncharacterized protein dnm_011850 [Desulfonema magnum]